MRAFEDLFIESKIKRRSVKECTDRNNLFKLGEKRYIYTTNEELFYLEKSNKSAFIFLDKSSIQDIFSAAFRQEYKDNCCEMDEFSNIEFFFNEPDEISIISEKEFYIKAYCNYRMYSIYIGSTISGHETFELHFKRRNGFWEHVDSDINDRIYDEYKDEVYRDLEENFIEICKNSDVDSAYKVYEMDYYGSYICSFDKFSALYDIVKEKNHD